MLLPSVPQVEGPAIVGVALEDVRGVQRTLDRGKVGHLFEEMRVGESEEAGAGGVEVGDELGEEIAAWVSFKNLTPNLVEPVTAESGAADCGGVFACLIEGFEDVIQLLQARVKPAKNALAECSDRAVFVNVPLILPRLCQNSSGADSEEGTGLPVFRMCGEGSDRAVGDPASAAHMLADFLNGEVAAGVMAESFEVGEGLDEGVLAIAQLEVGGYCWVERDQVRPLAAVFS